MVTKKLARDLVAGDAVRIPGTNQTRTVKGFCPSLVNEVVVEFATSLPLPYTSRFRALRAGQTVEVVA